MLERVLDHLGALVRRDCDLAHFCTYRVGGRAAGFVEPTSESELATVASAIAGSGIDVLIIGKGSNLLVADSGFDGLVLHLGDEFATVSVEGSIVEAGAAAMLPVLARRSVQSSLKGLEWAVGVPGTVGGGVRMNAGGHGSEIAECLIDATVIDLRTGLTRTRPSAELDLGYRSSNIASTDLVTAVRLQLEPGDQATSEALLSQIVSWRRANQPGGQNAGSVFANPEGDSAGRLIDSAGLKAFRIGSASVSDKHANFIQAEPDGSADDVFLLIRHIQTTVLRMHGVQLQAENRLIGFDGVDDSISLPQDDMR